MIVLLALIASAGVLAHGPFALGTLRVAGLGLLWWYAVVAAPIPWESILVNHNVSCVVHVVVN